MSVSSVSIVDFEQVNVQLVNILPTITLLKNSIEKRNIKVNKINFELTLMHSFHPLPWVIGGGIGGSEPFFRTFIQEGPKSIWDFWWELSIQVGVVFFSWDLKTPCMKNSEYESQAKNDSDCNFYNFSLVVPYPNKILVVCICILIFLGIYSLQPQILFFVRN